MAPIHLPAAVDCLKFGKGSIEELPNLDPFYAFNISGKVAPVPLIVKFICHLFKAKVSWSMVLTAISAISKYHVVDKNTGTPIGQHSLVSMAKKAFWQQRPPIPRYHGTYDVTIILRFIESLVENAYKKAVLREAVSGTEFCSHLDF